MSSGFQYFYKVEELNRIFSRDSTKNIFDDKSLGDVWHIIWMELRNWMKLL
jgi:hypothetical protein